MSKKPCAVRGMNDLLPKDSGRWLALERTITDLLIGAGYQNIRTPIVEKTDTFCRAIGEATDIVEKEMYSWQENSGDSLSLRPEGTAGCMRAMIEHNLPREGIQKLFYFGAMFRHERPQKGRYRQFHQVGVEVFGAENAKIDAELIALTHTLWQKIGLKNLTLELNSLGDEQARTHYKTVLVAYFSACAEQLDADSLRRLSTNPLRILDSKNPSMQALIERAPKLMEYLDDASQQHFNTLKHHLEYLKIPYIINPRLVRGLDYYNRSVFEWTTTDLGAQGTICAGGRYDGLCEKMGGKATPAIGFAIGFERLMLLLEAQNIPPSTAPLLVYLLVDVTKSNTENTIENTATNAAENTTKNTAENVLAQAKSLEIAQHLRLKLPKLILYNDASLGSFKSQFKKAHKAGADYVLILGETELTHAQISLKPLKTQGAQRMMQLDQVIDYFEKIL